MSLKNELNQSQTLHLKQQESSILDGLSDLNDSNTSTESTLKLVFNRASLSDDLRLTVVLKICHTAVFRRVLYTELKSQGAQYVLLNLPPAVQGKFLLEYLCPALFGPRKPTNAVKSVSLELGHRLCVNDLPEELTSDFISKVDTYVGVIERHCEENDEIWPDLWMFVVQFMGIKLHRLNSLSNKLLRVTERAFRDTVHLEQRLRAFDCWIKLIDNFSLNMSSLCSAKKLKLLLTPLRAKMSRSEVVLVKRFHTFVYLMNKLDTNVELCLEDFLAFVFGPFTTEDFMNAPLSAPHAASIVMDSTNLLLKWLSYKNCNVGELEQSHYEIFTSTLTTHLKPIVLSILRCCQWLPVWCTEEHNRKDIVKFFMRKLIIFHKDSQEAEADNILMLTQGMLQYWNKKAISQNKEMEEVLRDVADALLENEFFSRALKHEIFPILQTVHNDSLSETFMEKIYNFVDEFLKDNKTMEHWPFIVDYYNVNNLSKWESQASALADVWFEYIDARMEDDAKLPFLLWPIYFMDRFESNGALDKLTVTWSKHCHQLNDSTARKLFNGVMEHIQRKESRFTANLAKCFVKQLLKTPKYLLDVLDIIKLLWTLDDRATNEILMDELTNFIRQHENECNKPPIKRILCAIIKNTIMGRRMNASFALKVRNFVASLPASFQSSTSPPHAITPKMKASSVTPSRRERLQNFIGQVKEPSDANGYSSDGSDFNDSKRQRKQKSFGDDFVVTRTPPRRTSTPTSSKLDGLALLDENSLPEKAHNKPSTPSKKSSNPLACARNILHDNSNAALVDECVVPNKKDSLEMNNIYSKSASTVSTADQADDSSASVTKAIQLQAAAVCVVNDQHVTKRTVRKRKKSMIESVKEKSTEKSLTADQTVNANSSPVKTRSSKLGNIVSNASLFKSADQPSKKRGRRCKLSMSVSDEATIVKDSKKLNDVNSAPPPTNLTDGQETVSPSDQADTCAQDITENSCSIISNAPELRLNTKQESLIASRKSMTVCEMHEKNGQNTMNSGKSELIPEQEIAPLLGELLTAVDDRKQLECSKSNITNTPYYTLTAEQELSMSPKKGDECEKMEIEVNKSPLMDTTNFNLHIKNELSLPQEGNLISVNEGTQQNCCRIINISDSDYVDELEASISPKKVIVVGEKMIIEDDVHDNSIVLPRASPVSIDSAQVLAGDGANGTHKINTSKKLLISDGQSFSTKQHTEPTIVDISPPYHEEVKQPHEDHVLITDISGNKLQENISSHINSVCNEDSQIANDLQHNVTEQLKSNSPVPAIISFDHSHVDLPSSQGSSNVFESDTITSVNSLSSADCQDESEFVLPTTELDTSSSNILTTDDASPLTHVTKTDVLSSSYNTTDGIVQRELEPCSPVIEIEKVNYTPECTVDNDQVVFLGSPVTGDNVNKLNSADVEIMQVKENLEENSTIEAVIKNVEFDDMQVEEPAENLLVVAESSSAKSDVMLAQESVENKACEEQIFKENNDGLATEIVAVIDSAANSTKDVMDMNIIYVASVTDDPEVVQLTSAPLVATIATQEKEFYGERVLLGSPVSCNTPTKNTEFLSHTQNISPICVEAKENNEVPHQLEGEFVIASEQILNHHDYATTAEEVCSNSAMSLTHSIPATSSMPTNSLNRTPNTSNFEATCSTRTSRLFQMLGLPKRCLNVANVPNKDVSSVGVEDAAPPYAPSVDSSVPSKGMPPSDEWLTFSKDLPSPLLRPKRGVLKRKLEDSPAMACQPNPKRKRVNFSDPTTTEEKVYLKEELPINGCGGAVAEPFAPHFISCTVPIEDLVSRITAEPSTKLRIRLKDSDIHTVADLSRLSEHQLNCLNIRLSRPKALRLIMDQLYSQKSDPASHNLANSEQTNGHATEPVRSESVTFELSDITARADIKERLTQNLPRQQIFRLCLELMEWLYKMDTSLSDST